MTASVLAEIDFPIFRMAEIVRWWKSSTEENYRLHYDFKVVVKLFNFFGEHIESRLTIAG